MSTGPAPLQANVEQYLWPQIEGFLDRHDVAGLAVAVMRGGEVVSRGFGVRDVGTGAPVTPETMFHLASVSKPFVATAIVSLADTGLGSPALDLDAPITDWVPEFTLADGRAKEVTARGLLSHSSGLPDVSDYGWHDPQLGDDALSEFAHSLSGWRLQTEPGSTFAYSNAGYELLGLLLSRVTGTTFENAMREHLLDPLGMQSSTFLRAEVPELLAASPHVGMPLREPEGGYPYTRSHAPSSSLHSNLTELCRWMDAQLWRDDQSIEGAAEHSARLPAELLDQMWQPRISIGDPPWDEAEAFGWAVGRYGGYTTVGHSGMDPGFGSRLVLVPERRIGVVVLANSNTVSASLIVAAALDVALADDAAGEGGAPLRALLRPVVGPVAEVLATSGPDAAAETFGLLAAAQPPEVDLAEDGFDDAVWGAIELHRTNLVWPLLRLWTALRPDASVAWAMTGWAQQIDGHVDLARQSLRRALDLDPDNGDAALIMSNLPPG